MDKKDIAAILKQAGTLMELHGVNPFKARAFLNGARTVERLEEDVAALVDSGGLNEIKGIGKGLAAAIADIVRTGSFPEFEELKNATPEGLLDILRVRGLGAKKVRAIWKKLGITALGELEYACLENRLKDLEGFGEKTQQAVLAGIQQLRRHRDYVHLHRALAAAEEVEAALRESLHVRRFARTGELARFREVIRDVMLIVAVSSRSGLEDDVRRVMPEGEVRSGEDGFTVITSSGIPVELQIVPGEDFGTRQLIGTGSETFLGWLREKGDVESMREENEEDVFARLGLPFVPPELRESPPASLPEAKDLVSFEDLRLMLHVHTSWSDGVHSIEEMAKAARDMGFTAIGICDHSRSAFYANGLDEDRLRMQHEEIEALNAKGPGVRILKGIESDIPPDGSLDYPDSILETFDFIVASVHSSFRLSREDQTRRLVTAVRNPFTTILGHPTGRLLLARPGYDVDMDAVLEAAAESNTIIELNANPHRLDLDWRLIPRAKELGVKLAVNTDAHRVEGLRDIRYGVAMARKGAATAEDVVNTWSVERFLEWKLQAGKNGKPG